MNKIVLKPSEREERLRQLYPFFSPDIETAVWSTMIEIWGLPSKWKRFQVPAAHIVLSIMSLLTVETLSLEVIKVQLTGNTHAFCCAHKVLFYCLARLKGVYHADDTYMFRNVICYLENAGRTYYVLWDKDVKSFDDIAFNSSTRGKTFYVVRVKNTMLKCFLREAMMHTSWTFAGEPNQRRFDDLAALLDNVAISCPVYRMNDFNLHYFFEAIDEINRQFKNGQITTEIREFLVKDLIHLFRYATKVVRLEPYGPIRDVKILDKKSTVRFFLEEYVSLDKTYRYPHWQGGNFCDTLVSLDIENSYLRDAYGKLLESGRECRVGFGMCRHSLVESLGPFANSVGSPEHPFNEETFLSQMNFFIALYSGNPHRSEALSFVKNFYLSIDAESGGAFFSRAKILTYKLVTSGRFEYYCEQGFVFRRYSPYDTDYQGDKYVLLVSGMDQYRKNHLKEDYLAFDFSFIENGFYRHIAWRAVTSSVRRIYRKSFYYMLRDVLPFLIKLKTSPGYPVPQLDVIAGWDALFVAEYFDRKYKVAITYNHNLREVRDFLKWASAEKFLVVNPGALLCLKGKKTKQHPTNTPVLADNEIAEITAYLAKKAKHNSIFGQVLIIMQLSLLTPLRVSHSCSLRLSELVYDENTKSYFVYSTSKTSHGKKHETALGRRASEFIIKALSFHRKIVKACPDENLIDHLFIYQSTKGMFTVLGSRAFDHYFKKACEAVGVPTYTARNLRATYMTKAYIAASANGYIDEFLLKLFAYHRRVGTTIENYVNHTEAFAALSEHIKRGNDWQKTVYPDEVAAIKDVIKTYNTLLEAVKDESAKAVLQKELDGYIEKLEELKT